MQLQQESHRAERSRCSEGEVHLLFLHLVSTCSVEKQIKAWGWENNTCIFYFFFNLFFLPCSCFQKEILRHSHFPRSGITQEQGDQSFNKIPGRRSLCPNTSRMWSFSSSVFFMYPWQLKSVSLSSSRGLQWPLNMTCMRGLYLFVHLVASVISSQVCKIKKKTDRST